jgi:hypothetical protein
VNAKTAEKEDNIDTLMWDTVAVGGDLSSKVASRSRHINMLLGAGTSRPAGLPDVAGLLELILNDVPTSLKPHAKNIFTGRLLEDGLSRIRRIKALLEGDEEFEGLSAITATELDAEVSHLIIKHLMKAPTSTVAHDHLASWIVGEYYTRPIEVFTINYDLLIETALESVGASYSDGFIGNLQAGFRADIVEATGTSDDPYPSSFARVWKLHGSLNWRVNESGKVVRTGAATSKGDVAAIYPSDEKYDESRRVPFTVLQDRFRKALAVPESLTLISGYSFGDQHLNEILFDAARRYPRSEIIVFCHGVIEGPLLDVGLPNISVYGAMEAIIGSEKRPWKPKATAPESLWKDDKFVLGDFADLAAFLSRSARVERWPDTPPEASGGSPVPSETA